VTTVEPEIVERPETTDPDEPDTAHIGRKDDVSRAYVTGEAITALCVAVFVPTRDPSRYPVCKRCQEVLDQIRAGRTGQN
jgi:hypothetical protein